VGIRKSHKNGSKVESAINTLTLDRVEVPGSQGAKRVFISVSEIDLTAPDRIAATLCQSTGSILAGYATPSSTGLAEEGCVHTNQIHNFAEADNHDYIGPQAITGVLFEVPKYTDGKYYFTAAVKGENNAAGNTKTIRYHLDFLMEF
jgi:hypothetical protein